MNGFNSNGLPYVHHDRSEVRTDSVCNKNKKRENAIGNVGCNYSVIESPPEYRFCDIGFNMCDEMFRGIYRSKQYHPDDLQHVLDRAQSLGVHSMIITGTTADDSKLAIDMIASLPKSFGLFATIGIHPSHSTVFRNISNISSIRANLTDLFRQGISSKSVVAIGETGLDYDRLHFCDKETQITSFKIQLTFGLDYDLPFFFHDRNTNGDFYQILSENKHMMRCGGVVHSFTGTFEDLQKCIELGLFISINGCGLKTEENLEVVKAIPLDMLLIETDAPWCSVKPTHASAELVDTFFPNKKKEKYEDGFMVKDRGEPCLLVQVAEVIAKLKNVTVQQIAEITWANSIRLFKLDRFI